MSAYDLVAKIFTDALNLIDNEYDTIDDASRSTLRTLLSDVCVTWILSRKISETDDLNALQITELDNLLSKTSQSLLYNPWMRGAPQQFIDGDASSGQYESPYSRLYESSSSFYRGVRTCGPDFRVHPVHPRLWVTYPASGLTEANFMGCQPSGIWRICFEANLFPASLLYVELYNILRYKASDTALTIFGLMPRVPVDSLTKKKRRKLNLSAARVVEAIVKDEDGVLGVELRPRTSILKWLVGSLGFSASYLACLFFAVTDQWGFLAAAFLLTIPFWGLRKTAFRQGLLYAQPKNKLARYYWFFKNHENQMPAIAEVKFLVSDLSRLGEAFPAHVFALIQALDGVDAELASEDIFERGRWSGEDDLEFIRFEIERRLSRCVGKS